MADSFLPSKTASGYSNLSSISSIALASQWLYEKTYQKSCKQECLPHSSDSMDFFGGQNLSVDSQGYLYIQGEKQDNSWQNIVQMLQKYKQKSKILGNIYSSFGQNPKADHRLLEEAIQALEVPYPCDDFLDLFQLAFRLIQLFQKDINVSNGKRNLQNTQFKQILKQMQSISNGRQMKFVTDLQQQLKDYKLQTSYLQKRLQTQQNYIKELQQQIATQAQQLNTSSVQLDRMTKIQELKYPGSRVIREITETFEKTREWWGSVQTILKGSPHLNSGLQLFAQYTKALRNLHYSHRCLTQSGKEIKLDICKQLEELQQALQEVDIPDRKEKDNISSIFEQLPYAIKKLFSLLQEYEKNGVKEEPVNKSNRL